MTFVINFAQFNLNICSENSRDIMVSLENIVDSLTVNLSFYKNIYRDFQEEKISINDSMMESFIELIKGEIKIVDDIFEFRIKRVNEIENPYLPPVIHNNYFLLGEDSGQQSQLTSLLEYLINVKETVLKYIIHISPARYSRTGYHWQEGHISLSELIERYVENDSKFIREIQKRLL